MSAEPIPNPVAPYEWSVCYGSGARFHRVCGGRIRTSREAPLAGIAALRVRGWPFGVLDVVPEPRPVDALVVRATDRWRLGAPAPERVAWRFGFDQGGAFVGLVLERRGGTLRVTPIRQPWTTPLGRPA